MGNVLYAIVSWVAVLVIRIPLIVLGFVTVPVGLLFRDVFLKHSYFTQWNMQRSWQLVKLPPIFWIWSNDRDGMLGDRRGWWDYHCPTGDSRDFWSMFQWAAIRNPVNNLRFVRGISCDVSDCFVEKLGGQDIVDDETPGWQFLKANGSRFNYYQFRYYGAIEIRVGHKIKLSHNSEDWGMQDDNKVWKGFTFRIKKGG